MQTKQRQEYLKKWRKDHPEYYRKYYLNHIEQYHKYKQKQQTPQNRIKETNYKRKYLADLRVNSPEYRKYKAEHDKRYRQTQAGKVTKIKAKATRKSKDGTISLNKKEWIIILNAFNNSCAYCNSVNNITADHFIPILKSGHTTIDNIVPACSHCNSSKQAKMPQEWCSKEQLRCVLDIMATYS